LHLFYQPVISNSLSEAESNHAIKVLRLRKEDKIKITDGKGSLYIANILKADSNLCQFEVISKKTESKKNFYTHLVVAPTKSFSRIEWMVEKCVEIGVDEITFIQCQNSERNSINANRLQKVAISALKQSQQVWLPKINPMVKLVTICKTEANQKFVAHFDGICNLQLSTAITTNGNYCIVIGPEGDFTKEEIELCLKSNFKQVCLGNSRLRTETATIVALWTIILGNIK